MKKDIDLILSRTLALFIGSEDRPAFGAASAKDARPGTLAHSVGEFISTLIDGRPDYSLLPGDGDLRTFAQTAAASFIEYYSDIDNYRKAENSIETLFRSDNAQDLAMAVSEIWSPELLLDDDKIFSRWRLANVKQNPEPYSSDQILIQLNALYSPPDTEAPSGLSRETSDAYRQYLDRCPERIAVYDHPVPVFTRGEEHELEKCLTELDADIAFEKEFGTFPSDEKLKVLISVSTTHEGLDVVCEKWLQDVFSELALEHLGCFLLSENKARNLEKHIGNAAEIFTVQGKYACHFGALKYAQLIFEKAYGTRAGFKLDTDEGIHSEDMLKASGMTWLQQLCHPWWGGSARTADGRDVTLGFNIGEYVDSRDLDALGYEKAIKTPEVKTKSDVRGTYLLFNKGVCQAKGTMLLNRTEEIEDFISHPLVKGGGYGIDNDGLRKSVPVGFSMVGRAEDQQFYYSALSKGVQGIFNPLLRIIHYKAAVAKSEHRSKVGTGIADIYRMLLFRRLMTELNVTDMTRPFPANYASGLSSAQSFFLWISLIFTESVKGNEAAAQEYLHEGINELLPLIEDIDNSIVMERFDAERAAWKIFIEAVDAMSKEKAISWLEALKIS